MFVGKRREGSFLTRRVVAWMILPACIKRSLGRFKITDRRSVVINIFAFVKQQRNAVGFEVRLHKYVLRGHFERVYPLVRSVYLPVDLGCFHIKLVRRRGICIYQPDGTDNVVVEGTGVYGDSFAGCEQHFALSVVAFKLQIAVLGVEKINTVVIGRGIVLGADLDRAVLVRSGDAQLVTAVVHLIKRVANVVGDRLLGFGVGRCGCRGHNGGIRRVFDPAVRADQLNLVYDLSAVGINVKLYLGAGSDGSAAAAFHHLIAAVVGFNPCAARLKAHGAADRFVVDHDDGKRVNTVVLFDRREVKRDFRAFRRPLDRVGNIQHRHFLLIDVIVRFVENSKRSVRSLRAVIGKAMQGVHFSVIVEIDVQKVVG